MGYIIWGQETGIAQTTYRERALQLGAVNALNEPPKLLLTICDENLMPLKSIEITKTDAKELAEVLRKLIASI